MSAREAYCRRAPHVLRRVRRELRRALRLLGKPKSEREQGQLETLHYVRNVIENAWRL